MSKQTLEDVNIEITFRENAGDMNAVEMLREYATLLAWKKKTWVGLTGTEVNHIFAKNVGCPERMMKDVENLLKEKNT